MSGFIQALHSYRDGTLSRDELLAEVDRQLSLGTDTAALLAVLNEEQSKARLPGNVHLAIVRKLLQWREKLSHGETPTQAVPPPPRPAKSGRPAETWGAAVGLIVLAALLAAYFLDQGRAVRWIQAHRGPTVIVPVLGEVFRDCPTCPLMKAVRPGKFAQGAAPDDAPPPSSALPAHPVAIRYPFGMGVYEVTVREYKEFVEATDRKSAGCSTYDGTWQANSELNWNNVGFTQTATHPVTCVSWRDARDYAAWLSRKTNQRYRLPSDSEWEYAARGGDVSARPWGAEPKEACAHANIADETAAQRYPGWKVQPCSDGYVYTAPVGSFKANAFGFYDMLGNVFEWVQDCWHADYQHAPADGSAWMDGDCTQHDLRGGSWFTSPALVSTAARNRFEETYRSNSVGFRLVREIPP